MSSLVGFQAAFVEAIDDDGGSEGRFASFAGFAVYRNTWLSGCLDALETNYPAILCLVGRDWFRSTAAIYALEEPPRDGLLFDYGKGFADFLGRFPPASAFAYLGDVARLDRLWTECLCAADAATLDGASLQGLSGEQLGGTRLRPHPATRWLSSDLPAFSIWQASRASRVVAADMSWQPECALVTRVGHDVRMAFASPATLSFLDACARSATLAEAAEHFAVAHPDARIDIVLAGLLRAGAFTSS